MNRDIDNGALHGQADEAIELNLDALNAFIELAANDSDYSDRAAAVAQNSVSHLVNVGRVDEARDLLGSVSHVIREPARSQMIAMLA